MYKLTQKGIAHLIVLVIIILLLLGLGAGLYLVQKTQIFAPKAQDLTNTGSVNQIQAEVKPDPQVESLTNELLELDKQYDKTVQTSPNPSLKPQGGTNPDVKGEQTSAIEIAQINKMVDVSKKRKELLLKKLKENPQDFLVNANLVDKRETFPEEVKEHIEQSVRESGELTVVHSDDFKHKKSTQDYFLGEKTDRGKPLGKNKYRLYFKEPPELFTGSQVQIEAVALDKEAAVTSSQAISASVLAVLTPITGDQKTLVIMVSLSNDSSVPTTSFTADYINNFMFGTSPDFNSVTVNSYYKDNSFNKISFSGDVVGEFTVPSFSTCDTASWGYYADTEAVNSGINIGDYSRIVYVFKSPPAACTIMLGGGEGGAGTIGGNPSRSWIFDKSWYVYVHELGHNLGVHHANLLNCGSKSIDIPSLCQSGEYGDPTDVMGTAGAIGLRAHFNGPHKVAMGWIPNVQTITTSGTYTIAPLESSTSQVQVLRINKPDTLEYYYLSYRQKIGFDSGFYDGWIQGANLHVWNENPSSQTKLLDLSPTTHNGEQGLTDGASFFDQINNITVKQLSHTLYSSGNPGSVTVEVTLPVQSLPKRVFVTSAKYNGDLKTIGSNVGLGSVSSGLDGADKICQSRANVASLGGIWKAWLSDSQTPADSRLNHSLTPYKRLDGITIANSWTDLTDGNLQASINIDEYRVAHASTDVYAVWTNTKANGDIDNLAYNCSNWTSGSSSQFGKYGATHGTASWWTSSSTSSCNQYYRLFCFEEPAAANPSSSPSPTVSPSPSASPATYTVSYKVGENPIEMATASAKLYDKEPAAFDHVFKDQTSGAKFLFVEFKDNLGNLATRSAQIELLPPTQQLSLTSGWNLVSLNVEPSNTSLTHVLKPLEGRYTRVLAENGIFATTIDDKYNTLRELHAGKAYYLRLSGDTNANLQVNGSQNLASQPLSLHKGWNWIGYLPTVVMKVTDALQSIAGKYQLVVSLDKIYDPQRLSFSTLEEMIPGQGYLIYMNEDATLVYPNLSSKLTKSGQVQGISTNGCPEVAKTPAFTLAYGQVNTDGIPAPVGTRVEAITSQGVIAGCFITKRLGEFGMMYLYGKDTTSLPPIPGFNPNEGIIWHIDGQVAKSVNPFAWQSDRTSHEVSLNFKSSTQPTPTPLPTSEPAGRSGGGSSSGGGTGGTPATKRTIKYVKYAEDPYSLSSAPRVPYYPGDPLPYTFKNSPQGNKYFIFVRFEDVNGQVFKINGQDYITQSIDVYSGETSTPGQPTGGVNPPNEQPSTPNTPPSTGSTEQVTIGTISLSTSSSVSRSGNGWSPVSISLNLSGFSSSGSRSIAGLFVRNQTGECSINDCGYSGWTQIRSYGTNGTDSNSWTPFGDLSAGVRMFAAFSLNADGTAGQLLAVSSTNFEKSATNDTGASEGNTVNCIATVTPCTCSSSDSSADDYAGVCKINPGGCNGGWCKAGVCETCSQ